MELEDERTRMQKEIDRLKDAMSKTSGSLQNELASRDEEISKLQKKV